jgi:8-hydroxy-5-deazaflavin:NADPH oxidoreductase
MNMRIGIIGGGNIGLAFAKTLSRAGIAATIANSRGPDSRRRPSLLSARPSSRERASKPPPQKSS